MSTAESISRFLTAKQGNATKTKEKYATVFKRFLFLYPQLPLAPEPIEAFINSINGTPETRWTYQNTLQVLYHFIWKRQEIEKRHGISNPMKDIVRVRLPRKVRATLEPDQIKQLFSLDLSPQDDALLTLLMDTGLREGEIVSLDREHVHEDHVYVSGKTGEHEVPISPETYAKLIKLADSGPLFQTFHGRMPTRYLYGRVKDLLAQIGVTTGKRGPHMLRHSFARHYMAGGGDLMSLKEVLGHTKVTTTQIYAALAAVDVKRRHHKSTPLRTLDLLSAPEIPETKSEPEQEPFPEKGAVQLGWEIAGGQESPTPPCTIKEYAYKYQEDDGVWYKGRTWRIIGSNGAWWPTTGNPRNFFSIEEAQEKMRELWGKGGSGEKG